MPCFLFTFGANLFRMYDRKIPELLDCGLVVAIKVIGGKWKAWILDCIKRGVARPSAIHREMQEVSPRIINMHLKELEDYGIIYKEVYAEIPARVEYCLTTVGRSLLPVMETLEKWGTENRAYILRNNREYTPKDCPFKPEEEQSLAVSR
jgi:DNA-binding HxlR family transcriptional regulator